MINPIRSYAYQVLLSNYPKKMSASEIAHEINTLFQLDVSRKQVHNALRVFARKDKHFGVFPSFFPFRIRYSVYPFEGPYFD